MQTPIRPLTELQTLLSRYEQMLVLAEANDWDALQTATAETEPLRAALLDAGELVELFPPEALPQLRETLEAILSLDARIREHTLPCLESTRKLLAGTVTDRKVRNAYGAMTP